MESIWGLLGPEFLQNVRRTRTLGLNASVRRFNDLAVPGLGGVWYGKQLLLATLGINVAEAARSTGKAVQNIEMANATEALACWLAFKSNGWISDQRLRGSTKLLGKEDFSFQRVHQLNFYVTQPMRMATVQALPALGLVDTDSSRFNAFRCSDAGRDFVETALEEFRPSNRTVTDHLTCWAQRRDISIDTETMRQALSPLAPLSTDSIRLLRERLIQGGPETDEEKTRRCNALAWVETLRKNSTVAASWDDQPQEISANHWHDLQEGALFSGARSAALIALDAAEAHMGKQSTGQRLALKEPLPASLAQSLDALKSAANKYLVFNPLDENAIAFCRECADEDSAGVLRSLVRRDGQVLRLSGDEIKPGPAFRGSQGPEGNQDENPETPQTESNRLPNDISYRVKNLFLLNLDMHHELDGWLLPETSGGEA